jgi:hypothetical protein
MSLSRYLTPRRLIVALAASVLVALPVSALGSGGAGAIPRWMQEMMGGRAATTRMVHDPMMARMMRSPSMQAMMRAHGMLARRGSQHMMTSSGAMGAMMGDGRWKGAPRD